MLWMTACWISAAFAESRIKLNCFLRVFKGFAQFRPRLGKPIVLLGPIRIYHQVGQLIFGSRVACTHA